MKYDFKKIEKKWQEMWEQESTSRAEDFSKKPKFYCLVEFPYPSGEGLHVGHPRSYTALDVLARKRRMEGWNVLYPMGFDAFGLPTENYAIKTGIHPAVVTERNIETFTAQLKSLGFSFDWDRRVVTTDPAYYRWTQWIFLKMYEHGLAYKAKMPINWCPSCRIGLANEEVVGGACERCGATVEQREKEQWLLRITRYADRLIDDLATVDYPNRIKTQQINWIGRSEGANIRFSIVSQINADKDADDTRIGADDMQTNADAIPRESAPIPRESALSEGPRESAFVEVFTTRPDTLFGVTYIVLAPEHELLAKDKLQIANRGEVDAYIAVARGKTDAERIAEGREKTGVELKGIRAINPTNKEEIPIFVADYVLAGYGTGAIMAVPAHDERDFEFAKRYNLPVVEVVSPLIYADKKLISADDSISTYPQNPHLSATTELYIGEGVLINSRKFDGMDSEKAKWEITKFVGGERRVQYHLRDWIFSRQRYWGEPIPMVECVKCGWVPVPEGELPVFLPNIARYEPTETGESPLAAVTEWVNTKCPRCGGPAKRETDTMPNWAGSNWYFLRYTDPHNDRALADPKKLAYWTPVDWYNGGMEHTTLHLLYSRFVYKFLYDIGAVPKECGPEPYRKRTAHGMILGEGGEKMSKSRGNVVNPDEMVERFGADAFRVYEMFMGPFDQDIAWSTNGLVGAYRFLERVWKLFQTKNEKLETKNGEQQKKLDQILHKTIKKVTSDIENFRFNTAVSALMILLNEMEHANSAPPPHGSGNANAPTRIEYLKIFSKLLAPFAPFLAEELWYELGYKTSIHRAEWPVYDPDLIKEDEVTIAVQVNGKFRGTVNIPAGASQREAEALVKGDVKLQEALRGKTIKKTIYVPDRLINFVIYPVRS